MKKLFSIFTLLFLLTSFKGFSQQRVVIAEEFTGTWCPYCPGAQMGLRNLKQEVGDAVAIIAYHYNDPFSIPEVNVRVSYYGVTGYPTVIFDGVLRRVGGYPNQPVPYRDLFDQRIIVAPLVDIQLRILNYNRNTGMGQVEVTVTNLTSFVEGYLRCALIGKETLYYWQNQTHLYDICLDMFPNDANGQYLSLQMGQSFCDTYDFTISYGWRQKECSIVAFFQDNSTQEIHNGKEVEIPLAKIEERRNNNLKEVPKVEKIFNIEGRVVKKFNSYGVYFLKHNDNSLKKVIIMK